MSTNYSKINHMTGCIYRATCNSGYSHSCKYIGTIEPSHWRWLKWKALCCNSRQHAQRNVHYPQYSSEDQEGLEMAYLARCECCRRRKKVKAASNAGSHQGKNLRNTSQFKATATLLKTNGHDSSTLLPSCKNLSWCTNKPTQNAILCCKLLFEWSCLRTDSQPAHLEVLLSWITH